MGKAATENANLNPDVLPSEEDLHELSGYEASL